MHPEKFKIFFFVVCQAQNIYLSTNTSMILPAGRVEKGAKVCRCCASTSRGYTAVTVTTVIKTGLCIKSMHWVQQRLARCNREFDGIFFFLFNFIPLLHLFFSTSSRTKMLETVTQHNSLVWTCETGHKTAVRQRVPCRKRCARLQLYWTVSQSDLLLVRILLIWLSKNLFKTFFSTKALLVSFKLMFKC